MQTHLKVSVIFAQLSSNKLHDVLDSYHAKDRETKAVFLIRADPSGFITISYYSQEHEMVRNFRLGLTSEGWKVVPTPPKEPSLTDPLDLKTKYIRDKKQFDKKMEQFISSTTTLVKQTCTHLQIKSLSDELREHGFDPNKLIRPSPEQACRLKHFLDYVSDALNVEENRNSLPGHQF